VRTERRRAEETTAEVEDAMKRIESLQQVTEAGLAKLGLEDLLRALLDRTTEILHADTAAILLIEDDGDMLAARAAMGLEEEVTRGFRLPVGAGFAGRIAATRGPIVVEDVERSEIEVVNPLLIEKGLRSLLGVPLMVEGELIGVLHIGVLSRRAFSAEDVELLQLVADRAALAIERDRLYEQHRVAATFQQSLIPETLPEIPELGLAARYLPAANEAALGGDWFDVIPFPDGRVGLAIGDVVGSGVTAAALMGKLRSAVRAFALEGAEPAMVTTRVARFIHLEDPGSMATLLYASLELDDGRLTVANAGHLAPLLLTPGRGADYLEVEGGPPLGVELPITYRQSTVTIPPGALLLLYTDGLVERRGEGLTERLEALAAAASAVPIDAEVVCAQVIEAMLAGEPPADDVAVLSVQNLATAHGPLEVQVGARAEELATVRRLLRAWLGRLDAPEQDIAAITLACSEACANAVEHAYGPVDATFEVRAEHRGGAVELAITDSGSWRAPRGTGRGRGMTLMRAFMDAVEVHPDDSGTTVVMSKRLSGEKPS
jgi:serine phosphatase RsbU (regulator of sigma subunit)/anti-sigma regulatory factor (Ser/Thr protein kinase)